MKCTTNRQHGGPGIVTGSIPSSRRTYARARSNAPLRRLGRGVLLHARLTLPQDWKAPLVISHKLVVNAHILDSSALKAKAIRLSDRPPDRNAPNSPGGLTDMVATV
ncbi:MAG: hypothetical protein ACYDBJ_19575 [Aggregatilineales bacterium]